MQQASLQCRSATRQHLFIGFPQLPLQLRHLLTAACQLAGGRSCLAQRGRLGSSRGCVDGRGGRRQGGPAGTHGSSALRACGPSHPAALSGILCGRHSREIELFPAPTDNLL